MPLKIQFPPEGDEKGSTWRQEIAPPAQSRAVGAFGVGEAMKEIQRARAGSERDAFAGRTFNPLNQTGGWATEALDLSTLITGGAIPIDTTGYGIYYKKAGSAPGGLLDIELGGQVGFLAPGEALIGPFEKFSVRLNPLSATAGLAVLLISKDPRADFRQFNPSSTDSVAGGAVCGPAGAFTQTINSAAGNVPTNIGDGVPLVGVGSFRVSVQTFNGQTLSGGGGLFLWKRPTNWFDGAAKRSLAVAGTRWAPTPIAYTDLTAATTVRQWMGPEETVGVADGELYVEARSVTASGGAGLIVSVETW